MKPSYVVGAVAVAGGLYLVTKLLDRVWNIGETVVSTIVEPIEEVVEGAVEEIYTPSGVVADIIAYYEQHGYSTETMQNIIKGHGSMNIPESIRKFLPSEIAAHQYVSLMWSWANTVTLSDVANYHGIEMPSSDEYIMDTVRWAPAKEWVVSQYEAVISYMEENDMFNTIVVIS